MKLIIISTNKGDPIVTTDKHPSGQAYRNITKRIMGETVPLMSFQKENIFAQAFKKIFKSKNQ